MGLKWIKQEVLRKFLEARKQMEEVERACLRWLEDEENDLRVLIVKRWRQIANETEDWVTVVKEVKVQTVALTQ
jgi:hypothetical protein